MTRQLNDELIKQLAMDIDQYVAKTVVANKEEMHPLEVTAIFISRLMLMHRSLGTEEQFRRLTTASLNIQEPSWREQDAAERPN